MDKNIYVKPHVSLLGATSAILPDVAARCCYDSYDKSDNQTIKSKSWREFGNTETSNLSSINPTFQSDLAEKLAHVYHHSSIIEHSVCTFEVVGVGRGVLQELARHRIGVSLSVKSTRYTLTKLIAVFVASDGSDTAFHELAKENLSDMLVIPSDNPLWKIEMEKIRSMLETYSNTVGYYDNFLPTVLSKEAVEYLKEYSASFSYENLYGGLSSCKQKRNAGDSIKFVVSDLWATDLVITFNARSLSHFMKLRDSGAAWFPIRELAQEIYKATPESIQRLVKKPKKEQQDA